MPTIKDLALPALVNCVALLVYVAVTLNVGRARGKYNVPAPQVSGNPDFERALRVQANTLEQMAIFMPALWISAFFFNPMVSAGLGGVWILGRILYAWGYYQAAEKRGPGFGIAFLANIGLTGCAIWGAIKHML